MRFLTLFLLLVAGACSRDSNFPVIDYSKLKIELTRSACYGECPDYLVAIDGNGNVLFSTDKLPSSPVAGVHREFSPSLGVLITGTYRTKIDRSEVTALVEKFRAAGFFQLKDAYQAGVTDSPTYTISIDTGNGKKKIVDYVGREAGMPLSVTLLERAIDDAAGTDRWIKGTPGVIPLLQQEGVNFDGDLGLALMSVSASRDDVATMAWLFKLGAPLSIRSKPGPLEAAAAANRVVSLRWLLDRGLSSNSPQLLAAFDAAVSINAQKTYDVLRPLIGREYITRQFASRLVGAAAQNGNVSMVTYLLTFEPDLAQTQTRPLTDPPLFRAASSSCAETSPKTPCDHREVVRLLLAAGADIHGKSSAFNSSVLFLVGDPQIAKLLLQAGADPQYRDQDGEPIIFSISDEDVALVLLDAGAPLNAVRPADKMTLRGWAEYQRWPRVLKRLDAARRL